MLKNLFITLSLIGCVGNASSEGGDLGETHAADVRVQSASPVVTSAPICDPSRAAGAAPLANGMNAPSLSFATASGAIDTRSACGTAMLAVTLDEACTVCREFVRFDANDLLRAWRETARTARVVVVVTRVGNGRGGFRTAQVSDIARIRSQYELSSDVEVAVDPESTFSQLGYLGPKIGLLLDANNHVVSFGSTVDMADVLATR